MRKWLRISGGLLLVILALSGWSQWSNRKLRASVEETRQQLRREGFKTELADFDLRPTTELLQRADAISKASSGVRMVPAFWELRLMQPIGDQVACRAALLAFIHTDTAPSGGAQLMTFLRRYSEEGQAASPARFPLPDNLWDLLAAELQSNNTELDAVCLAVGAGEFRFEPTRQNGIFQLPYLGEIKKLAQVLSARAMLAIHEHRTTEAFTNLLALTQLTTHWQPEPIETSHLVRFDCTQIAQAPLWEALQADGWSDDQLAALQHEWESVEFFAGLPESVAFQRASMVQLCRDAHEEPFVSGGWWPAIRQIASAIHASPTNGLQYLKWLLAGYRQHSRYRNVGSYEDEKGLFLYYREREIETKRAVTCQTWDEMCHLPGVTNFVPYDAAHPERIGVVMYSPQITLGMPYGNRLPLGRAAEVETRRRLMVTAIALKRFQLRLGRNPDSLAELTPTLLRSVPLDFMDGRELRYQRFEDDRFILYSVGLDCTDNGGQMRTREQLGKQYETAGNYVPFTPFQNTDLVWPMPANEDEMFIYELSTDETVTRMNQVILREIERKYVPPRPEENVWPYRREFE